VVIMTITEWAVMWFVMSLGVIYAIVAWFVTPADAKALTRARIFGGVPTILIDEFGVEIRRGIPDLGEGTLRMGKDDYTFSSVETGEDPQVDDGQGKAKDQFAQVLRESYVWKNISKRCLVGVARSGVATTVGVAKAADAAAKGKKYKGLDALSLANVKACLAVSYPAAILQLLEARYEKRGQFGKGGPSLGMVAAAGFIIFVVVIAAMSLLNGQGGAPAA
jgi:hypothetical protein